MKKIGTMYTLILLVSLVLVSGITSSIVMLQSVQVLQKESSDKLESVAINHGLQLDQSLLRFQGAIDDLANLMSIHFKTELHESQLNTGGPLTPEKDLALRQMLTDSQELLQYTTQQVTNNISGYLVLRPDLFPSERKDEGYPYQILLTLSPSGVFTRNLNVATEKSLLSDDLVMAWYRDPISSGQGVWSQPYEDPYIGATIVTYSTPILVDGTIVGVIGIDFDFKGIQSFVEGISVYKTGYAFLFDENYQFLAHPFLDPTISLGTLEGGKHQYVEAYMDQHDSGTIQYVFQDSTKILGFYTLSNGWTLAMAPPVSEVYQDLASIQQDMMVALALGIILFGGIATFLGIRISKPLDELSGYVESTSDVDANLKNPVPGHLISDPTEVGQLATALETLRSRLDASFNQIQEQNIVLDKKVTERTEQLAHSNAELAQTIENLKSTQSMLVEARKQEALNNLIQNLAHKLNTPIGNAITASTFLLRELDSKFKSGNKDQCGMDYGELLHVRETAQLIYSNQQTLRGIVESLRELMDDYADKKAGRVHLKSFIQGVSENVKTLHRTDRLIAQIFVDNEWEITSYPGLLSKLFENLFSHSVHLSLAKNNYAQITIESAIRPGVLEFTYIDENINTDTDVARIFDPFFISPFRRDDTGLELQIVYKIVTQGFGGKITATSRPDSLIEIKMELPILIG